ncbi:MAG: XTP/dITP diphosphatase [Limnochordia bacterium]|nr:XTP/dITP diphosphatase [Bacillota bacterium]
MARLVVASRNEHKIKEIQAILADQPWQVLTAHDFPGFPEVVEDGSTLEANAIKKAKEIAAFTGCLALADDTGLEVDALGGKPGVHSARFAGPKATYEENNRKLLRLLEGVPPEERTARFRCVIAIAEPDGNVHVVEGKCEGLIGFAAKGEGGFGYDPLFIVDGMEKTFAELSPEEKNRVSHRGRALQLAAELLAELAPLTPESGV